MENYTEEALRLLRYSENIGNPDEASVKAQQATAYMLLAIHDSLKEVAQKLEDIYQLTAEIRYRVE